MMYLSPCFRGRMVPRKFPAPARPPLGPSSVSLSVPPAAAAAVSLACLPARLRDPPPPNQNICDDQVTAKRNHRLKHAKLRPLPEKHFLQGGSRSGAVSVTEPVAVPPTAALDSPAAIGRQLLSRHVSYADFDSLPDPSRFQLHQDLKGWKSSPARLDFLYKELVRQRNAAVRQPTNCCVR